MKMLILFIAQIEKLADGSGIIVHMSPGIDPDEDRISHLSHLIQFMTSLSKLKTSRTKVKVHATTEEELESIKYIRYG